MPFSKSKKLRSEEWNVEHVLQDAFGDFGTGTLTLVGRVCKNCNKDFGDSIDRILTRSSFDALNRFKYGVKSVSKLNQLGSQHMQLKFDCPENQVWHDVNVEFYDNGGKLGQRLSNQYAFKDRLSNKFVHLTEEHFHRVDPRIAHPAIDLHGLVKIVARSSKDFDRLISRAYYKGVFIKPKINDEPIFDPPLYLSFEVAAPHQRAIAKVAFNYLAKLTEYVPALVLGSTFNGIRSFIKTGLNPGWQVVLLGGQPFLKGETQDKRRTNGHLVSAHCKLDGRNVYWIGQVTIFNELIFQVQMTNSPGDMYYQLDSCHHWCIETNTCTKLDGINRDGSLLCAVPVYQPNRLVGSVVRLTGIAN